MHKIVSEGDLLFNPYRLQLTAEKGRGLARLE